MARVFIFDSSRDRIRTLYYSLKGEGYEVASNMTNVDGQLSQDELDPVRALRVLYTAWDGNLPEVIIIDCLDVDSVKFLEELHKPFMKKELHIIVMTDNLRANSLLQRLMKDYGAFCMVRPFEVNRFLSFVQEINLPACASDGS